MKRLHELGASMAVVDDRDTRCRVCGCMLRRLVNAVAVAHEQAGRWVGQSRVG